MVEIQSSDPLDVLRHFHTTLDTHFRDLHESRSSKLEPAAPVFALEHDLGKADLLWLLSAVRAVIAQGLSARHRQLWLPFVVYAAEEGYDYVGEEYWQSFERATPGWQTDLRPWLKEQFLKFARDYGGAVPTGAFAKNFTIIAWPITHAVLPTYLQRQLAQLLYEFRTGLSTSLLSDPDELGVRLAVRAQGYTERFRIFCQNTALLGQVAAALLSGDEEESPYLITSTLQRLVEGLSRERQSRHWLTSARQSASRVRSAGIKGSRPTEAEAKAKRDQLPSASDPRFFLRYLDGAWNAYAELPDLTPLSGRLPHVYDELRTLRARVTSARRPVPTSALVRGGQEVRFESWPDPSQPFVQLERGTDPVNALLADQCVMTSGPWWLYRCHGPGLAIEVKGRFLRPGQHYILVGRETLPALGVSWSEPVPIHAAGVTAYRLDVPEHITDADVALLVPHGISVLSSVAIRPVGIVASAWDGDGAAEWLAGEPAIIGIRSEFQPTRCLVTVDDEPYFIDWPARQTELVMALDGLDVGTHDVTASLVGHGDQELFKGSLIVTIRDPQVRPENATVGEGIRMLVSPARPTMAELWDEHASVTVDGPIGVDAQLIVSLRSSDGRRLSEIRRKIDLPADEEAWAKYAKSIRTDRSFKESYDEAESCVITVSRGSIGFAALTCERGFQPLRWRFTKDHDSITANLHDRTDGGQTRVDFFTVEVPLTATSYVPDAPIALPPRGGLLQAVAENAEAAVIAPTNPNAVFALGQARPTVSYGEKSPSEVTRLANAHWLWSSAELPADPFATHQQHVVLEAIAQAITMMICGYHWAQLERTLQGADDPADYLQEMRDAVGISDAHKALATQIGRNLYRWLTPETLIPGFAEVIAPTLSDSSIKNQPSAARFLLTLSARPGYIADWAPRDRDYLLERIVASPVLLRAARFAVLGTRALNDVETEERGF